MWVLTSEKNGEEKCNTSEAIITNRIYFLPVRRKTGKITTKRGGKDSINGMLEMMLSN